MQGLELKRIETTKNLEAQKCVNKLIDSLNPELVNLHTTIQEAKLSCNLLTYFENLQKNIISLQSQGKNAQIFIKRYEELHGAFKKFERKFIEISKTDQFLNVVKELYKQRDSITDFNLLQYLLILSMDWAERKVYSIGPVTSCFVSAIEKCRNNDEVNKRNNSDIVQLIFYMTLAARNYVHPDLPVLTQKEVLDITEKNQLKGVTFFNNLDALNNFLDKRIEDNTIALAALPQTSKNYYKLKNRFEHEIELMQFVKDFPDFFYKQLFSAPLVEIGKAKVQCLGLIGIQLKKPLEEAIQCKKEIHIEERWVEVKEESSIKLEQSLEDLTIEQEQKFEYIAPEIAQKDILEAFNRLQEESKIEDDRVLAVFRHDKKNICINLSDKVSELLGEEKIRGRFKFAASKGFVANHGRTGIKTLVESGDLMLTEVKVLGKMQKNGYTIGDLRLLCLWNTKENIMYGFALQNHKEVSKTIKAFEANPKKFFDSIMEQFKQETESFRSMVKNPKENRSSRGY